MIAHFGHREGSSDYFIVVDTDLCATCENCPSVAACPSSLLEWIFDDCDEKVCAVKEPMRGRVKHLCAPCKPPGSNVPPPCMTACEQRAIQQTW